MYDPNNPPITPVYIPEGTIPRPNPDRNPTPAPGYNPMPFAPPFPEPAGPHEDQDPWGMRNWGQSCPNWLLDILQTTMHDACDVFRDSPDGCADIMAISYPVERCRAMRNRMRYIDLCLRLRWQINIECYGGQMDRNHRIEYNQVWDRHYTNCSWLTHIACDGIPNNN